MRLKCRLYSRGRDGRYIWEMAKKIAFLVHKQQQIKVKEMMLAAKVQTRDELGHKIEQDSWNNEKLFYRILKTLKNGKQTMIRQVMGNNGRVITNRKNIMEQWR